MYNLRVAGKARATVLASSDSIASAVKQNQRPPSLCGGNKSRFPRKEASRLKQAGRHAHSTELIAELFANLFESTVRRDLNSVGNTLCISTGG